MVYLYIKGKYFLFIFSTQSNAIYTTLFTLNLLINLYYFAYLILPSKHIYTPKSYIFYSIFIHTYHTPPIIKYTYIYNYNYNTNTHNIIT